MQKILKTEMLSEYAAILESPGHNDSCSDPVFFAISGF